MNSKISDLKIKAAHCGLNLAVLAALLVVILAISCGISGIGVVDAAVYLLVGAVFGVLCGVAPSIGFDKNAAEVFLFVVAIYVAVSSNSIWIAICMILPNVLLAAGIALYIQHRHVLSIIAECSYPDTGRRKQIRNKDLRRNKKKIRKTSKQTR